MQKKRQINFQAYFSKNLFFIAIFFILKFIKIDAPLPLAIFSSLLYLGYNSPLLIVGYVATQIIPFSFYSLAHSLFSSLLLTLIFFLYKKCKRKMKFENIFYTLLALIPYIFINAESSKVLITRSILSLLILVLTFLSILAIRAFITRGVKFKPSPDEICAGAVLLSLMGLGLINIFESFGMPVWRMVSVYLILLSLFVLGGGFSAMLSGVLALSITLFNGKIEYVGCFLLWSLISAIFKDYSKILSTLSLLLTEIILAYYFKVYFSYSYIDLIFTSFGAVIFLLTPKQVIAYFQKQVVSLKEKRLPKNSINRNRSQISSKLYDISSVFSEIETLFTNTELALYQDENTENLLANEIIEKACNECGFRNICELFSANPEKEITRVLKTGLNKGHITLIDIPKSITSVCKNMNGFLYTANQVLGEYKNLNITKDNANVSKELIGMQAGGVAQILRSLAVEFASALHFNSNYEKKIAEILGDNDIYVYEVLVFGEDENLSISTICDATSSDILKISNLIGEVTHKRMMATDKAYIPTGKVCIYFKPMSKFDAVFGASGKTKDKSLASGDTHLLLKLKENKFMLALSDGMGSGEKAKQISTSAISLIENFYLAGLDSSIILSTINKLLSINSDDTYSALDICVVDLESGYADFIKIGSPYGFIISRGGVQIIEGNSLPLGILDEMKPTVSRVKLKPDDIIVLATDGVTSAFSSSTEMAEYLSVRKSSNPQTLADELLKEALKLYNEKAEDDMTVLCLRIFER